MLADDAEDVGVLEDSADEEVIDILEEAFIDGKVSVDACIKDAIGWLFPDIIKSFS